MPKNPHAVALGQLGGAKGGKARARTLSASRRTAIARAGGAARAKSLSAAERSALSRRAARARWKRAPRIVTAAQAPEAVRRLLKTYDPSKLRWTDRAARYTVVREILVRGDAEARAWLQRMLRWKELRELVREFAGTGCSEPERARLRREFRLSTRDIPTRPHLAALWAED